MFARALLLVLMIANFGDGVSLYHGYRKSYKNSKSITSLESILISCRLTDILIISAPITTCNKTEYRLINPNGNNITNLKISSSGTNADFIENNHPIINSNIFKVMNKSYNPFDDNQRMLNDMKANEYIIGPVTYSDHGNWVLSLYNHCDKEWSDTFQVITVEVIENIPARVARKNLQIGDDFELGFAAPLPDLVYCKLVTPKSIIEREYEKIMNKQYLCGYWIRNVTYADAGLWEIIGVGRIMYETKILLEINGSFVTKV